MEIHFDQELAQLKESLLRMSALAESSVAEAFKSLITRDDALAQRVHDGDDEIDRMQMEIDDQCIQMIALRQPIATDLRMIIVTMKIVSDLERMGDQAVNIAHRVMSLNREPPIHLDQDISKMAEITKEMIRGALDTYVYQNCDQARKIIDRDDEVDALTRKLHQEFVQLMMQTPPAISRFLSIMSVVHNLERIADYATNIAEEVVYLYEAKDIRHRHDEVIRDSTK